MAIIFAILLFSFLIFIHELGHFVAAKLSGIQVNEFSIFMGPAIFKKQVGETLYAIRCIPIGGYCAMEGEDQDTDNPRSFRAAKWWKRLIVLIAGSFMNFVVGVLLVAIVLFWQPSYVKPQVTAIEQWSTVDTGNGLQVGDTILEFNGEKILVYEDFSLATIFLPDGNYDILVERNGQQVFLEDVLMERHTVLDASGETVRLYGLNFSRVTNTPQSVPGRILPTAFNHFKSVIVSLKMLFTGQASVEDMTGPVGIVTYMADIAEQSAPEYALMNLLSFGAAIAINLAVMNMLPIPALDGGRAVGLLLTTAVEKVTKKKVNSKVEGYIHGVGMVLLLILMAVVMFKDVFMLFKG